MLSIQAMGDRTGKGVLSAFTLAFAIMCAMTLAHPAHAQSGAKQDSVGMDAVDAVTQPLSDLNLRNREIPLILVLAQQEPYDMAQLGDCDALRGEIARLEEVLGPDADAPADKEGLVNKGLKLGGSTISGFIPFRGLVRQVSGANANAKRWQAAIYAGVARRSYLKGYLAGQECPSREEMSVQSARDVLGMAGD